MVNLLKLVLVVTVLACTLCNSAENLSQGQDSVSPKTDSMNLKSSINSRVDSDLKITPIGELPNEELIVKLNGINEMSSSDQRELLIEIQRRILKEGPEPFIEGRKDAIKEATAQAPQDPKLEDETIKIVTTEVRVDAAEEFVRDPEKANVKKTGESQKKPVPYGSAYSE